MKKSKGRIIKVDVSLVSLIGMFRRTIHLAELGGIYNNLEEKNMYLQLYLLWIILHNYIYNFLFIRGLPLLDAREGSAFFNLELNDT